MPTGNFGPGYPAIQAATVAPQASAGSGGASEFPVATIEGAAVGTVTIGGTTGSGPTATVTIGGNPVTYTYVSGDTTTTLAATHVAAAINANGADSAVVTATSATNVVTITAKSNGAAGMLSLASSATGGATAVASGAELDLAGNVVIPTKTFALSLPGGAETFYAGVPEQVDAATKASLRSQGLIA